MTTRLWISFRWALLVGVMTTGLASSARAEILVLESLTCRATEDSDGDECILRVHSINTSIGVNPDNHNCSYRQNMLNTSRPWMLNRRLFISGPVEVSLFDEDDTFLNPDDCLGRVRIEARPTAGTMTAVFNQDDANYVLRFRVESETPPVRIRPSQPPRMRVPPLAR
jgi:hypothetical protein